MYNSGVNRSGNYTDQNIKSSISTTTTGLTDLEGAKAVARRIFDTYDKNRKGVIAQFDTVPMIVEAYKSFNQYFSPSSSDISSYFRVLDRNGDGQVTYSDIEELCIRYLCPQYSTVKEAPKKAKYTPEVEQRLDVARRLFKKFDKDNTGVLDSDEVKGLIGETYAQMGMQVTVTDEDVKGWIEMTDPEGSGQITLQLYENLVLRSLVKSGIQINNDSDSYNKGYSLKL